MKKILILLICTSIPLLLYPEPVRWVFTDYPPANYIDEEGNFSGFLYEITKEAVENRMNIPLEVAVYPWARCQQQVKTGHDDMFLTIPTKERLEYAVPTEAPVWIKKRIIYTYRDHRDKEKIGQLRGLDQIKQAGLRVISYNGNLWTEDIVEETGIPVEYANGVDGMYRMLAAKRGDIIIEEKSIVNSNITKLGLEDMIVETKGVAEESGFHLLISKKSTFLGILEELNRVIEEMWADGTIETILEKYDA